MIMKSQFNDIEEACDISKPTAMTFVVLFGIVSLFSDMTHEGARSVTRDHS